MITVIGLLAVAALIYFVYRNVNKTSTSGKQWIDPDEKFNMEKNARQKEVDRILEKIEKKGMDSLNKGEKDFLNGF